MLNLSQGFLRLWVFFTFLWICFCAYQLWDARVRTQQAQVLLGYYAQSSAEAKALEGQAGASPIVSAHLAQQLESNTEIIKAQKSRSHTFLQLLWLVPLVSFIFARGIPWVWSGFYAEPCSRRD